MGVMSRFLIPTCLLVTATACGSATGIASNAPIVIQTETAGPATAVPTPDNTVRTVLSSLGINFHTSPSLTAPHPAGGAAAWSTILTVLGHDPSPPAGGWYQVKGQTATGWIVADPTLTAPGSFTSYASQAKGFSVLYPLNSWTFIEETNDVVFHPQSGTETIVVRSGASLAALGGAGLNGYTQASDTSEVVCGVTSDLITYTGSAPAAASAAVSPAAVTQLSKFAQIRLKLDATHYLDLEHNYDTSDESINFDNFYNSLTFPFPQCQK